MPALSALTERGAEMRSWLPLILQNSPDHLAVVHAYAREMDRCEEKLEQVRRQWWPTSADILLGAWEHAHGLPVAPAGLTIEERREAVLARVAMKTITSSGLDWQDAVSRLVGSEGWTYDEYLPAAERMVNLVGNPRHALDDWSWIASIVAGFTGLVTGRAALPAASGRPTEFGFRCAGTNPDLTARTVGAVHSTVVGEKMAVTPGVYTMATEFYSVAPPDQLRLDAVTQDAAGTQIAADNVQVNGSGAIGWYRVIRLVTVPAGGAFVRFRSQGRLSTVKDFDFYVTRHMFVPGDRLASLPDYFDGSMSRAEWLGTQHRSTSRRTSPPANTIRVVLPFTAGTAPYIRISRLLREIVPMHLAIQVESQVGFALDTSPLDQGGVG